MSSILLRWLNEDLALKQRVLNLEHDFSNGYLLGEILHKHNHQHDFNLFQDSSNSEVKANNFILLEPSLRLLGVQFDAQVAYNVMQGKLGTAGRLLYQVKMVLDRLTKFSVPVSMRPTITAAGVKPLPNLPQRTTKLQYDRATHEIFAAAVRDMVQSQKGINLERSLQRFKAEGTRQKQLVQIEKKRSLLAEELHTEAIRVQGLHDLAQRKALAESWEETNVDDWLINMARKRDRKVYNHLFLRKVNMAHQSRLQRARMAGERAVQQDLPEFEARSREAARTARGNQEEHEATPWALSASTRGFLEARALEKGYEWQMTKFHAKRSAERTGAREKRRRRFTTEREESLSNSYFQEGTEALKLKLMKRCQAEEQVERQLESVFRYKAIMTENRQYRTQQYAVRADVDAEGLLKRDQASLDSFRREYELGVRVHLERCDAAGATREAAAATRIEKICREMLGSLIAVTMEVVVYRAHSEHWREPDALAPNQDPMPSAQWRDMKWSFIRGGPLLQMGTAAIQTARKWGNTPLLPLVLGEEGDATFNVSDGDDKTVEKVARFLDGCEFQDYLNETGCWAKQKEKTDATPPVPGAPRDAVETSDTNGTDMIKPIEEATSDVLLQAATEGNVLATADPLHGLGECVVETSLAAHPLSPSLPPPVVPQCTLRICMCGRTLTGKSEQAIRLADRYCLKVLSAEELAQRAMDNAANAIAAGRKTLSRDEALGQEASSALLQGGTISDKVYAALLVEAIKEIEEENQATRLEANGVRGGGRIPSDDDRGEYMGWIIDDFPGTAEQARVLEKHLSGYDEAAHISSRYDAASKLAPVSPVPVEQKGVLPSGIDIVIYIDVPRETILKRNLGRLFDPVTAESYHFEGSLPQYDVVCKERLVRPEDPANASAQLALQVAAQEQSSGELKAFLNKFGTLRIVDSGEGTPDALFGKLNAVVVTMIQEAQAMDTSTGTDSHADGDGDAAAQGGSKGDIKGEQSSTETLDSDASRVADTSIIGSIVRGDSDTASKEAHQTIGAEGASSTRPSTAGKGDHWGEEEGHSVLTGGLAVAVAGHWRAAEMQFEESARQVFREFRNQRLLVSARVRSLRDSFSAFLHRPDDKQSILTDFCACFNSLDEDLRFDDRARKELLLRIEECRSRLWFDVEGRKACATTVLRSIKTDGWVERQKGMLLNHAIVLMQAEVERFHAGTSLLHDYHNAKTQEAAHDDSILMASLIPPEVEGNSNKDVAPTKGKKDKDPKGKKGHDSGGKGGKGGGKGDSLAESTFAPPGGPTALPPCPVLASLVDVVGSRSSPQVSAEAEEAASAAGAPGKGKADKGKKTTKKTTGKLEDEVEVVKSPIAAALAAAMEYADSWGPQGFPVPREEVAPEVDGNGVDGRSAKARQRPSALLLHRAVWAQAEVLTTRCRMLFRVGEAVAEAIRQKADLIYGELHNCLNVRVVEEAAAVEACIAIATDSVDSQGVIEHEWKIQGGSFEVEERFRLVPFPDAHTSVPDAAEDLGGLIAGQGLRLRDALISVRHTGTGSSEEAVVMPEAVVDVLLRLSAEEGALPDCWACLSKAELVQLSSKALDPDDVGEVAIEKVVSIVTSKTPEALTI